MLAYSLKKLTYFLIGFVQLGLSLMARGLKRKLFGNTPPNRFLYKVNMEAVKKEKEKYATENSWVSTNDVLCEWIFTKV